MLRKDYDRKGPVEERMLWSWISRVREDNWGATWIGKVAAPGLENRDYGRGDPSRWPRDPLYQPKLALTSPAGCGRSVGIVRLRTKTTEFSLVLYQGAWCQDEMFGLKLPVVE
jgi:hypothetical protein